MYSSLLTACRLQVRPREVQLLKKGEYKGGASADKVRGHTGIEHLHKQVSSFRYTASFPVLDRPFCSSPPILPSQPACSLIEVCLYYFVFTSLPLKPVRFRLELRRKLFGIFLRFLIGVDIEVQEIFVKSADVFPDGFEGPELTDLCRKIIVM